MYPTPGGQVPGQQPPPGLPFQSATPAGPIPGMPVFDPSGVVHASGAPTPAGSSFPIPAPVLQQTPKRRPRNWHLALGGAVLLGIVGGIISPSGVFGFAWSLVTLAALGAAAFFGLKRGEEYRQQRQAIDLARGFATSVPVGQEAAVPAESLALVASSATAAATRVYGDRIYLFSKPPAEAEAEAAALLTVANRAKAELDRRGTDPAAFAAAPAAAAPVTTPVVTGTAAPTVTTTPPVTGTPAPSAPAAQAPTPDSAVTEFILKHSDKEDW